MRNFLTGFITGIAVLVAGLGLLGWFAFSRSKAPTITPGSTLIIRLEELPERAPVQVPWALPGTRRATTVAEFWTALNYAASDSRISAVIFEPGHGNFGWARMQEVKTDLEQFRKSGKPLVAWLRSPGSREYYMAMACQKIYIAPVDTLDLKGVSLETMYFRNTLEKLGVTVDVEHAGKYKDYGDMFVRSSMSPETKEVMNSLVDGIYGDLTATVAKGRGKDEATARALIDRGPFLSAQAKAEGLVDDVVYEEQVFDLVRSELHQNELIRASLEDYSAAREESSGSRIAFVAADGSISGGEPTSEFDDELKSDAFDRALTEIGRDKTIRGVIVRINSPGGEVTASDEMWKAMNELRKKKPVVISMSDYAASGGYYMAMSGDPIVAYPATLTGSIGVVFGKPNLHGLYDKLGITKDSVKRGHFAQIESDYSPLTEEERLKLKAGIDADYEDFVGKVAAARRKPAGEIEPLAQGRVWLGTEAKANGLVDEIGGISRAVDLIRTKAGIKPHEKISLVAYPGKRSLLDMVFNRPGSASAEERAEQLLLHSTTQAGLGNLAAIWTDSRLRIWARGGMLQMMPFSIDFR